MLNKNLKTIVINKKIFSGNKATNFIYKIEANNFDNIFSVNEIEGKGDRKSTRLNSSHLL